MYFEVHGSIAEAIQREKRIKRWRRAWKIELIEGNNPGWRDLWPTILGDREVDSRLRGNDGRGDRRRGKNLDGAIEYGFGEESG